MPLIAHLFFFLSSLLAVLVWSIWLDEIVKPEGEFIYSVIATSIALLWSLVGLVLEAGGASRTKRAIHIAGMWPVQVLLFVSWFFLLANILIYPAWWDSCKFVQKSIDAQKEGQLLQCTRNYSSSWAWAVTVTVWFFLWIFVGNFACIAYWIAGQRKEEANDYYQHSEPSLVKVRTEPGRRGWGPGDGESVIVQGLSPIV
jgi:hypothetical protein